MGRTVYAEVNQGGKNLARARQVDYFEGELVRFGPEHLRHVGGFVNAGQLATLKADALAAGAAPGRAALVIRDTRFPHRELDTQAIDL